MKNRIIQDIETEQMKNLPDFRVGDTVQVQVEVKEGNRTRVQGFEGVVIAIRNRGINSSFTVRKISHGEGVERVFQTHSPVIKGIEIKRRGHVRKAKLYHLRGLTGKGARIRERLDLAINNETIKGSKDAESNIEKELPDTEDEVMISEIENEEQRNN